MFDFISQHQSWTAVVIYWIFSAAVSSMPDPALTGGPGYLWLFRFLHSVAGNITTAFGNRIPGVKALVPLLLIPVLSLTNACAASRYTVHPGALNNTDSAAYDTLLVAEAAIDEARVAYEAGRLPNQTRPALNALIQSYNVAREAWFNYRGAIAAKTPAELYFQRLTQNLQDLSNAIHRFEEVK